MNENVYQMCGLPLLKTSMQRKIFECCLLSPPKTDEITNTEAAVYTVLRGPNCNRGSMVLAFGQKHPTWLFSCTAAERTVH